MPRVLFLVVAPIAALGAIVANATLSIGLLYLPLSIWQMVRSVRFVLTAFLSPPPPPPEHQEVSPKHSKAGTALVILGLLAVCGAALVDPTAKRYGAATIVLGLCVRLWVVVDCPVQSDTGFRW